MRFLFVLALIIAAAAMARAQKAMMFNSVDQYIDRAQGIWVVEDVRQIAPALGELGGPRHEVRILQTLKGPVLEKTLSVTSVFRRLMPGERYLFFGFNLVHLPSDSDFWMDNGNISPVPIPATFPLEQLKGKPAREAITLFLQARATEIKNQIKDLSAENSAIEAGLGRTR